MMEEACGLAKNFHARLCATRVLDPACGAGNFLYVALELMKRLEGEVIDVVESLGGQEEAVWLDRQNVDPHQFLGMEINPRAAAIAELVLWIGFLQWHFRTRTDAPPEPILRAFRNIEVRDAVLEADVSQARDASGKPLTRAPSSGLRPPSPARGEGANLPSPLAGEGGAARSAVTDEGVRPSARKPSRPPAARSAVTDEGAAPEEIEIHAYANPRRPDWPAAEYIVGNPPFIGKGEPMRAA